MIVLGISDGADASAALVVEGELVAAATEEATRRVKRAWGFPSAAIDAVLDVAGLRQRDVDRLAFAGSFTPSALFRARPGLRREPAGGELSRGLQAFFRKSGTYMIEQSATVDMLTRRMSGLGFTHAFVDTVEHDRAHATCAYRTQPREKLLVLTLDAPGDGACFSVSEASHIQLDRIFLQTSLASIGVFTSRIARLLGVLQLPITRVEAPDTLKARLRKELFYEGPGFSRTPLYRKGHDPLQELAGEGEKLAAAAQSVLKEAVCACVLDYIQKTRISDVALAGTLLQNPRLAGAVASLPEVRSLWVPPMPGEAGLAIGAALHIAGTPTLRLRDPCLGPRYSEDACYKALSNGSFSRNKVDDPEAEAARLLSTGKQVARFAGPLEFSPYGLGNRDFLQDASLQGGFKEPGVAVLAEDAASAFPTLSRSLDAARFQTLAVRPAPAFAATYPGALQEDGVALPQVVMEEDDPGFYKLLRLFKQRTGKIALASSPLAAPDEPVACSPMDALHCWRNSTASAMLLGSYLLTR